jgi:hypothetical protein
MESPEVVKAVLRGGGEGETCVEIPFVSLVDDNRRVFGQEKVALDFSQKNTVRHELYHCLRSNSSVVSNLQSKKKTCEHRRKKSKKKKIEVGT